MTTEIRNQAAFLKRIERLERENRGFRIAGLIAMLGFAGVMFLGVAAAPTKTLEAESLVVRDPNGKARIILAVGDAGPAFSLVDKNGKLRVNLGMTQEGPALDLLDAAETPRAQILITDEHGPLFNLYDSKGTQVSFRP